MKTTKEQRYDLRSYAPYYLDSFSGDLLRGILDDLEAAEAEIARLREQLPEGMKHCIIKFVQCEKGHGWLTATNWIQHKCQVCELERLRAYVASQPCKCCYLGDGDVMTCARCKALGKERQ